MATIYVGTSEGYYATISEAVAAAKSIDGKVTIEIAEGEYTENVSFGGRTFIEDGTTYVGGITFKAMDGADVRINGYFQCNAVAADIKDVVFDGLTITNTVRNGGYFAPIMFGDNYSGKKAAGIVVSNCTLNSTATNGTSSGVALTMGLECSDITISGNTINADCGVYGGDGNLIADTAITGNVMNGNDVAPNYNYWGVVYIYNSGEGNEISGNTIDGSALDYAVRIRNGAGVVLTDNTITDCGEVKFTNGSVVSGTSVDGEELSFPAYTGSDLNVCGGLAGGEGATVIINGLAYTVGTNVTGSFVEALKAVDENTGKINVTGNITESATSDSISVVLSKDLTISGGNVTWDGGSSWVWFNTADGVESVNLKFEDFVLGGNNTKVFFFADGVTTVIGEGSSISMYNGAAQAGTVIKIEEGGELRSMKEAFQVQANGELKATLILEGAEDFDVTKATLDDRQAYLKYTNVDGKIQVTDSFYASYDYVNVRTGGSFVADNSLVEIGADENRVGKAIRLLMELDS